MNYELPLLLFLFLLLKIIQTFIIKLKSNNVTRKFWSSSEFDCSIPDTKTAC